jgi:hypothetical protein
LQEFLHGVGHAGRGLVADVLVEGVEVLAGGSGRSGCFVEQQGEFVTAAA